MQYRAGYPLPQDSPLELAPRRVAVLLGVAAVCGTLAFFGGRSLGDSDTAPSLSGELARSAGNPVSQRLRAVPDIPALNVPEPEPEPTSTFPTTPTTPSAPSVSPPAASPAPSAPAPAPAAPAPSGGGGSFDDSG